MPRIWHNIRWGVGVGVIYAVVTVVWVGGVATIVGFDSRKLGISFGSLALAYLVGFSIGGLVLGLLRPWLGTAVGCIIAVSAALVPVVAVIDLVSHNRSRSVTDIVGIVLTIGIPAGLMIWWVLKNDIACPP